MSRAEQYSWASLLGLVAVFWWFQMRLLDGVHIVDLPASALLGVYIAVIAATTVIEIAIAAVLAAMSGKSTAKDERDVAIDRQASLNERIFMIAAINILIWQALMEGVFGRHPYPRIDLSHLPTLFFSLFAVLFGGEIVKRISTILLHRLQTSHG